MAVVGRHIRDVHSLMVLFWCIIIRVLVFSQLICVCLEFFCIILGFFNRWVFVGSGGTLWWMGKGWGGHQQNCIGYANMQNQSCLFWPPIIATKNALLHCTTFLQKKSRVFQPLRLLKHIIALHSLSSGWFNMNIDLDMIYMKYKQYRGLNTDSRY